MKALWADPEKRKAMQETLQTAHKNPETRARHSAAAKETNARPEVKAKIVEKNRETARKKKEAKEKAKKEAADLP